MSNSHFKQLPEQEEEICIFWFRRDLRLFDNTGLFQALISAFRVLPLFIYDTQILSRLEDKDDIRLSFLNDEIEHLENTLKQTGAGLICAYGDPIDIWKELTQKYRIKAVYANEDYEPYGMKRDSMVREILGRSGADFKLFNDHLIFRPGSVLKEDRGVYSVYTPFSRRWKAQFHIEMLKPAKSEMYLHNFIKQTQNLTLTLDEIGFKYSNYFLASRTPSPKVLAEYEINRNTPAIVGTSRIGVHLRFGTVSIRESLRLALEHSETWLNELIWREFFAHILWHYPLLENQAFKRRYDLIEWRDAPEEFQRWCEGKTGYPIVDAGMRELNNTGFMHNRVRMISASFLSKHLLIDWRLGEAWFARKLLDFELASNNGNWQWASGSGCDAAPYFRIFNPYTQQEKFDPAFKYIRSYVPEFETSNYINPMVEHKFARERCLSTYKKALENPVKNHQ